MQLSLFDEVPQQLLSADEMYDGLTEKNLRKWIENHKFEKKSALIPRNQLGEYFSMWANTPPEGGIIIVGISKNNEFEGCEKIGTNKINDLQRTGPLECPDAAFRHKLVEIHRDKDGALDYVLGIRVKYHPTKVVHTVTGRVFQRFGESKHELTDEQVRNLRAEKGEISLEKEPVGLKYPSDFRRDEIARFAHSVRTKKNLRSEHTDEEILCHRLLGEMDRGEFVPWISCALLFANDPRIVVPGCRVRFLRFEGTEEQSGKNWNVVKDEWIDGTVPELIVKTETVLKSQLRNFSRLGPGGKFITSPEYPQDAWYEAIVNALVHRAYGNGLKNGHVVVKMFDDRLEIESPGPFMPSVNPSNIYDIQLSRNPYLMDAMYYLDYVRAANEGTRRMRDEMKDMDLPSPEFSQENVGQSKVRVVLRNRINQRKQWVDSDIAERIGSRIVSELNEKEKLYLNFITVNGTMTVAEAQRIAGVDWKTAKKALQGLVTKDLLTHVHKHDGAYDKRDSKAHYRLGPQFGEDPKE